MTYHALVSSRGCVEYNALFVIGSVAKLEHGKWYTNQELSDLCGAPFFLRDSANAVEKNIKKWRYERQP